MLFTPQLTITECRTFEGTTFSDSYSWGESNSYNISMKSLLTVVGIRGTSTSVAFLSQVGVA